MPRTSRLIISDEKAVYHVMSRTALDGFRRYVYEAGALSRPEEGNVKVIEDKVVEKERSREFELSKTAVPGRNPSIRIFVLTLCTGHGLPLAFFCAT